MTREFVKSVFECFYDRDSGRIFSDLVFRKCRFESSRISITREPKLRSTVRNARFIQCEEIGCALNCAIVEDVLVDGLKTSDLFQTWGAVFKHVTFRGKIGQIMMSPFISPGKATLEQQRAFDIVNEAFYRDVDWALDIREAEFEDADIRRIPARLIRRDPETQVVVTREKALAGAWRELDLSKVYLDTTLQCFLEEGDPDMVLVAPKRHRKFRALLDGLNMLRDAGIAE